MHFKEVIKKNRFKTKIVLAIYLSIYVFIGLLVDVILYDQGDLLSSLLLLVKFQVIPYATLSMLFIGAISMVITIFMFKSIQLSGDDYIEVSENNKEYKQLYNIVEGLKLAANLRYMPKIYIIKANYMNAFASGWSEKNSMVAITEGLMQKLNREEIEAVMAHELTHIRNEDIKLTLVIGILSNIMLLAVNGLVRIFLKSNSKGAQQAKMILFIFQFILPIITLLLQMWLSRSREYMADAGAVELSRNPNAMANALKKISGDYNKYEYENSNPTRKMAYIFQKGDSMFSTHPDVKNRIDKIMNLK